MKDNSTFSRATTERSPYQLFKRYRCHHNTRYDGTRETNKVLKNTPAKRMKNTNCPFNMTIRIYRNLEISGKACHIDIEWNHNHPLATLQVSSFNDIATQIQLQK